MLRQRCGRHLEGLYGSHTYPEFNSVVDSVTDTRECDLSSGLAELGLKPSSPETVSVPPHCLGFASAPNM